MPVDRKTIPYAQTLIDFQRLADRAHKAPLPGPEIKTTDDARRYPDERLLKVATSPKKGVRQSWDGYFSQTENSRSVERRRIKERKGELRQLGGGSAGPVKQDEKSIAGYAAGAVALERSLAGGGIGKADPGALAAAASRVEQLRNPRVLGTLSDMNEAIHATRKKLQFRGNVRFDVSQTMQESYRRTLAGRSVGTRFAQARTPLNCSQRAAVATALGAGNCGEYALVLHQHMAKRLKNGQRLFIVGSRNPDHAFVALYDKKTGVTVTGDGWELGKGALLALDNRFVDMISGSRRKVDFDSNYTLSEVTTGAKEGAAQYRHYKECTKFISQDRDMQDLLAGELAMRQQQHHKLDSGDMYNLAGAARKENVDAMRRAIPQQQEVATLAQIAALRALGYNLEAAVRHVNGAQQIAGGQAASDMKFFADGDRIAQRKR